MTGSVEWETLLWVIGTTVSVTAAAFVIWWRIEGRVNSAKNEATFKADAAGAKADLVSAQLAEHKLHVAETYVSKAGLRETMQPVLDSINSVGERVDKLNTRLDHLVDNPRSRRQP